MGPNNHFAKGATELVDFVDDATGLNIHVFGEPRGHFHQGAGRGSPSSGMLSQDGIDWARGVSIASSESKPFSFARLKTRWTVRVPAIIELTLIFVGPLLHDVVRPVHGAACRRVLEPANMVVDRSLAKLRRQFRFI